MKILKFNDLPTINEYFSSMVLYGDHCNRDFWLFFCRAPRMKKLYTFILCPVFILLVSCGNRENGENGREAGAAIRFVTMDIFQQENNCDTSQNECTTIYFSYPRKIGSGNNALQRTEERSGGNDG